MKRWTNVSLYQKPTVNVWFRLVNERIDEGLIERMYVVFLMHCHLAGYGRSIMKGIEPGRLVSDLTELPGFDKSTDTDSGIEDCGSVDSILPFHYVKDLATAILGDVDRIDTP